MVINHVTAAAWTRRTDVARFCRHIIVGQWREAEEFTGAGQTFLALRTREQAVVADTVKPRGRTWCRKPRMNSLVPSVITWWRCAPSRR